MHARCRRIYRRPVTSELRSAEMRRIARSESILRSWVGTGRMPIPSSDGPELDSDWRQDVNSDRGVGIVTLWPTTSDANTQRRRPRLARNGPCEESPPSTSIEQSDNGCSQKYGKSANEYQNVHADGVCRTTHRARWRGLEPVTPAPLPTSGSLIATRAAPWLTTPTSRGISILARLTAVFCLVLL